MWKIIYSNVRNISKGTKHKPSVPKPEFKDIIKYFVY